MYTADQQTVRVYRLTVGSPERAAAHRRVKASAEKLFAKVGSTRLFGIDGVALDIIHTQLFSTIKERAIGRLLTLLNFLLPLDQQPTSSTPSYALIEMLTTKKINQQIIGLSEYTDRQ